MSQNKGIFEAGLLRTRQFSGAYATKFFSWAEEDMAPARRSSTEILSIPTLSSLRVAGDWPRPSWARHSPRDTVSLMSPTPDVEAHYGVPMIGAVLNSLNYRLDASTIAFILDHGESKVIITDRSFHVISEALAIPTGISSS